MKLVSTDKDTKTSVWNGVYIMINKVNDPNTGTKMELKCVFDATVTLQVPIDPIPAAVAARAFICLIRVLYCTVYCIGGGAAL